MSRSKLGVNLPPIADYYSGARYYADLVKTSAAPGSYGQIESGDPGPLDADGWPTGDHGRHLSPFGKGLKGTLRIIGASGRLDAVAVRSSPDKAVNIANERTGGFTADLPISSEAVGVSLQIKGTGLGRIEVRRPGYANSDATFTRELLDLVRLFGFARFMDAFNTNTTANKIVRWSDRALAGDQTYMTRGMPWDHAIDLANAADVWPWVNLPYPADEDCARRFAGLVRDRLKPGLMPIFECDNEGWGQHFEQGQRYQAEGEASTDAAVRAANHWGGDAGGGTTYAWAMQAKRVDWFNRILLDVYGSRDKYRLILNAQADSPQCFETQLDYFRRRGLRPSDVIHAVAIAPYGDLDAALVAKGAGVTEEEMFAPNGIDVAATHRPSTQKYQQLAREAGVRCYAYEAGINCQDRHWGVKVPAIRTAQSDPRMGERLTQYVNGWDFTGGASPDDRLFGYFMLQGPWLEEGPAANFGCTEDVADLSGPKIRALIDAAERHPLGIALTPSPLPSPSPQPSPVPQPPAPQFPGRKVYTSVRTGHSETLYPGGYRMIHVGPGTFAANSPKAAAAWAAKLPKRSEVFLNFVEDADYTAKQLKQLKAVRDALRTRSIRVGMYLGPIVQHHGGTLAEWHKRCKRIDAALRLDFIAVSCYFDGPVNRAYQSAAVNKYLTMGVAIADGRPVVAFVQPHTNNDALPVPWHEQHETVYAALSYGADVCVWSDRGGDQHTTDTVVNTIRKCGQ